MTQVSSLPENMNRAAFTTPDPGNAGTFSAKLFNENMEFTSAGAETRTLAAPIKASQLICLQAKLLAGNVTFTVTGGYDAAGSTSLVFTATGQIAFLRSINSNGTLRWEALYISPGVTGKTSGAPVAAGGASLTVSQALHDGKTIKLDQATGTAVTLPALTGSGAKYRFAVTVTKSGGSDVITAPGAYLFGSVAQNTDTANGSSGFTAGIIANAAGITTITLDGTTKGGRKGDWIEIEDVGANLGIIRGSLNASGTEATPFS